MDDRFGHQQQQESGGSVEYFLDAIVSGDLKEKELRVRWQSRYEASVSKKKLPIYEEQGWQVIRENKTNYRIGLAKTPHEKIEDEVWSLFAQLGFEELNKNREFRIQAGSDGEVRKVDIFAKDAETVLVGECTSAAGASKKKPLTSLIDKIKSYREMVYKAVAQKYGRDAQLKIGYVIATRGIRWASTDEQRAQEADIAVLKDEELDYYAAMQKQLKAAARYQLLAHVFRGKSIRGLDLRVPATRGSMGGSYFYNFLMRPADLLKIAYVGHKSSRGPDALDTYQRMLKASRLKDIAAYINDGGRFPTNIVINLESKRGVRFDEREKVGDSPFGELYLPNRYASAWVIDGQHRLYGYALSDRAEDSVVPVLAFENLPSQQQKDLFVDINHKQVKVPRGLLLELYADLHWDSPDPKERLGSLASSVVKTLGKAVGSPLNGRIAFGEDKQTDYRCLKLASIATALEGSQLLGTPDTDNELLIPGPLGSSDSVQTRKKAVEFLILAFEAVREAMPQQWEAGRSRDGGYICTNNSIVSQVRVIRGVCDYLRDKKGYNLEASRADEAFDYVWDYYQHAIKYLATSSPAEIKSLRAKVGSSGQREVAMRLLLAIREKEPSFHPPGLSDWIATFDKEGTEHARNLIPDIQRAMFDCTMTLLRREYPEGEQWWFEGVPPRVRKICAQMQEDEAGAHPKEHYLQLLSYKEIAAHKWSTLFQPYFSVGDKGKRREEQLSWIKELATIRNTVSHPERGLISTDEYEFVREIHSEMQIKLAEFWPR